MHSLFTFTTPATSCGYLPDETWRLEYEIVSAMTPAEYQRRLERGWRRFGFSMFHPKCPACQACRSLRGPGETFRPNRSQRRGGGGQGGVGGKGGGAPGPGGGGGSFHPLPPLPAGF